MCLAGCASSYPPVVLLASFALIGWNIGLRFTHDVLAAAARALPQCLAAIVLLMAFCGILAGTLTALFHADPLTAYLATSPGGVDAAAIIAASTKVDTPFVMALQTVRMIVLLLVGPHIRDGWRARLSRQPRTPSQPRRWTKATEYAGLAIRTRSYDVSPARSP